MAWSMAGLCLLFLSPVNLVAQTLTASPDQMSIQTCIDLAKTGDTVIVNEGTYYEQIDFKGKAITVASRFILDGDASHITRTIIDGSLIPGNNNASVVYFKSGEDTTSVLCGLTIRNGRGTYHTFYDMQYGGGVSVMFSGAKIIHNRFLGNRVIHQHRAYGGAIFAMDNSYKQYLVLRNNVVENNFVENTSYYPGGSGGAGIHVTGYNLLLEYNDVKYNIARGRAMGAGMLLVNCTGQIRNNFVDKNQLFAWFQRGFGAGICIQDSWPGLYITGNLISDNMLADVSADGTYGGGIAVVNRTETHYNDLYIERNTVLNNQAQDGGGIFLQKVYNVSLTNNLIRGNYASNFGAGVLFSNNDKIAGDGTGIETSPAMAPGDVQPVTPVLINNTLSANYTDGWGGGMGCSIPLDIIGFNNIFCSNYAAREGNAIYLAQVKVAHLYHNRVDPEQITGSGYWEGTGNLCEDPELDDMCHLCWNSPCANAGIESLKINGNWYYSPSVDIDGETRPYATTKPDIGADESTVLFVGTTNLNRMDYHLTINPNPVKDIAYLEYQLDKTEFVTFSIYNLAGEQLEILVNEVQAKGQYRQTWDPELLPSGIYFCVLHTGSGTQTRKVVKF